MENAVLKATGLVKNYGGTRALDGLELELPQGKIVGLLGPNGSGKTTFLKLASGLLTPTAGEITICGEKIGAGSKALVSYLPDRTCFSRQRKVTELLDFFGDFYEDFDRSRATQMLTALGIDPEARFRTLSKGTQEKVQLVGFGSFEVKARAERVGRNPKTAEAIKIPASKLPVFKAGKALKDAVAK